MELTKQQAKQLYPSAPEWLREKLETEWGKDALAKEEYELLATFNDLCVACGTTEKDFTERCKNLDPDTIIYERMKILFKAMNGDWMPDNCNPNQRKWSPYFKVSGSGPVFARSFSVRDFSYANAAFPLCYKEEKISNYAGQKFGFLWISFLTKKQ